MGLLSRNTMHISLNSRPNVLLNMSNREDRRKRDLLSTEFTG